MKKIHMTREQLVAEATDLITEDLKTQAFDGEILPDLLTLIPTEKLIDFLPADEEDDDEDMRQYILAKERFAALAHWEERFRDGTVDDEHADFIADTLAGARRKLLAEYKD